MTKQNWFIVISLILVVTSGVLCFKNLKNFRKSLYWLLFPNIISIWSKKIWNRDFENTFRFDLFVFLSVILVGMNYLIFRFIL